MEIKKLLSLVFLSFFMFSLASAGVTIETQPNSLYNLGDTVDFSVRIVPEGLFEEVLTMNLVCGTLKTEFYKEYLYYDEETTKRILIPLTKNFIGESKGLCYISSVVSGKETKISNDFTISNLVKFDLDSPYQKLNPGESFFVKGRVFLENGDNVEGVVEGRLMNGEEEIFASSQVSGGVFSLEFFVPLNYPAGDHTINLYSYEKGDDFSITNEGRAIDSVVIRQVPTNIEVLLEDKKILPGSSLEGKILLHDQTGEKIDSGAFVVIKNEEGEIVEKFEKETNTLFEYNINSTQPPAIWSIGAYSEEIINKVEFEILERREVDFELVNGTLIVENVGNVPYEDLVNITLGEEILPLEVSLGVLEKENYYLSAPNGEYEIKVGDFSERAFLTGNAVGIKKSSVNKSFNFNIVWIFLIFILGFVSYTIFRKGYKRTFFGRVLRKKKKINQEGNIQGSVKKGLITPKTNVELSLSIAGTKQNAVVGCLSLKNYEQIKSGEGNVHETLENIINMVESRKGLIYKNHGNIFYIFAPVVTKTFKNESLSLDVTKNILEALNEHNRKFKAKIDFGLAVNYGTIVTQIGVKEIKFMTMGTLMTDLKKMSSFSKGEIYFGEKIKDKLATEVKAEAKESGNLRFYEYKGSLKKSDHSPFIKGFMERQQKERMAKENFKKE